MTAGVTIVFHQRKMSVHVGQVSTLAEQLILSPLVAEDFSRAAALGCRAFDQPAAGRRPLGLKPDGPAIGQEDSLLEMLGRGRQDVPSYAGNQSLIEMEPRG